MSCLLAALDVQAFSNLLGVIEIAAAVLLGLGPVPAIRHRNWLRNRSLTKLTFLFTTPWLGAKSRGTRALGPSGSVPLRGCAPAGGRAAPLLRKALSASPKQQLGTRALVTRWRFNRLQHVVMLNPRVAFCILWRAEIEPVIPRSDKGALQEIPCTSEYKRSQRLQQARKEVARSPQLLMGREAGKE